MTLTGTQLRQAQLETAGTACWLLMDVLWMLEWAATSTVLGVATWILHLMVYRFTPPATGERAAHTAVTLWVVMNLLWMTGDQFERPELKPAALGAVALSFVFLGVAVWQGGLTGPFLQRFRRLRFRSAADGK